MGAGPPRPRVVRFATRLAAAVVGAAPEARLANEAFLWAVEHNIGSHAVGARHGEADATGVLSGIAVSAGSYTGPVRIIRSEREFARLRPGDVLVCPVTSPVWSVLFPSIGALVTDIGGMLSHPAIIAREYRLPAVVATGDATSRLTDGRSSPSTAPPVSCGSRLPSRPANPSTTVAERRRSYTGSPTL